MFSIVFIKNVVSISAAVLVGVLVYLKSSKRIVAKVSSVIVFNVEYNKHVLLKKQFILLRM